MGSPASSSSTSSTSSVHKASLVDVSLHSPALLELLEIKVTKPVIDYIIDSVEETVDFAMGRVYTHRANPKFTTFVNSVITRAEITTPVILASLVYIDRARPHLRIALEEWAQERVFLGALMVASKYLNDSTLKNVHWALCTGVFGKRDVGRIEREFLNVLDFQLGIREADLLAHHDILARSPSAPPVVSKPFTPSLKPPQPYPRTSHLHHSPCSSGSSSSSSSPSMPRSAASSDTSPSPSLRGSPMMEQCPSSPPQPPRRPLKAAPRLSATTLEILRAFPVPGYHQRSATAAAAAGNGKADSRLKRNSHRTSMMPPHALFT